ncbi:hypothetical protein EDC04DRAFT_488386 [Pisolithus marmoratus]|nr:hypothetical protein EDC04DRAFT_488386 [Pisolithus marmoratus]
MTRYHRTADRYRDTTLVQSRAGVFIVHASNVFPTVGNTAHLHINQGHPRGPHVIGQTTEPVYLLSVDFMPWHGFQGQGMFGAYLLRYHPDHFKNKYVPRIWAAKSRWPVRGTVADAKSTDITRTVTSASITSDTIGWLLTQTKPPHAKEDEVFELHGGFRNMTVTGAGLAT